MLSLLYNILMYYIILLSITLLCLLYVIILLLLYYYSSFIILLFLLLLLFIIITLFFYYYFLLLLYAFSFFSFVWNDAKNGDSRVFWIKNERIRKQTICESVPKTCRAASFPAYGTKKKVEGGQYTSLDIYGAYRFSAREKNRKIF